MFLLLLRDGARLELPATDLWEAMRAALRLDAVNLHVAGDPPRCMDAADIRQALMLDRPGLFDAFAPGWQAPSAAEFRELLKVAKLTSSQAGLLVGVPGGKVRKWAGADSVVPYAVWRLLTLYAGLAEVSVMPMTE